MMFFSRMKLREAVVIEHLLTVSDRLADLLAVDVEGGRDVEAVVGEDRRAGDRLAEPAGAEERDVVLALRPQDLADLAREAVDVVADARACRTFRTPERSRRICVALMFVYSLISCEEIRSLPILRRLGEDAQVLAQPRGDTRR